MDGDHDERTHDRKILYRHTETDATWASEGLASRESADTAKPAHKKTHKTHLALLVLTWFSRTPSTTCFSVPSPDLGSSAETS